VVYVYSGGLHLHLTISIIIIMKTYKVPFTGAQRCRKIQCLSVTV